MHAVPRRRASMHGAQPPIAPSRATGRPALAALVAAGLAAPALPALAQDSGENAIVVTPYRSPTAISRAGTDITVVNRKDIEEKGQRNILDAMRGLPGVDVRQAGNIGNIAYVTLRGSSPGQTLILVDGVRMGDTTSTDGSFDFGTFNATDIERIEILKGPQSALYGSDAMGGVINIITRKGSGRPKGYVSVNGGSYGSKGLQAGVSGGTETLSYSFSLNGQDTTGFSSYGYRIGRIPQVLENDNSSKLAGTGRIGWKPADNVEFEIGGSSFYTFIQFDDNAADNPLNKQQAYVSAGYTKATMTGFDGLLRSSLLVYLNRTDRFTNTWFPPGFFPAFYGSTDYRGTRTGVEWQNDLKLGNYGLLIFGLKSETEAGYAKYGDVPRNKSTQTIFLDDTQTTNSAFTLWQVPVGERLSLSFGGRVDDVTTAGTFWTWRTTAAYLLDEYGTKLRSSAGTGAKAPTLYQKFNTGDPNGTDDLQPEHSIGVDAGIDQRFMNGRLTFSATAFYNRYRDLIDFRWLPGFNFEYFNVARAVTAGVETSASYVIVPDEWRLNASYTYLYAENLETNTPLLQRPRNKASVGLVYTGIRNLEIEGRLIGVSSRYDFLSQDLVTNDITRVKLAPYARLDAWVRYKVDDTWSLFANAVNLTNAHYQEAYNYGTAGRSFYAGIRAQW
ncbi:TonB-dependent receptor plug domain-containing protein [Alsobacter sp. R-9]